MIKNMSNRALVLTLAFLIPVLIAVSGPFSVSDLAVWIALGKYFIAHGELLRHDIFSVLPTSEMIYPSWGISLLYALIYQIGERMSGNAGGLLLVCLAHVLVALPALLWVIYRNSIFRISDPTQRRVWVFLGLFILGTMDAFAPRPAMVALIPLVLAYTEISSIESEISWKKLLRLFLVGVVWVNMHGSFILLPILLAWRLLFVRIALPKRLLALGLTTASLLLNPWHSRIFSYVIDTIQISKGRFFTEWEFPGVRSYFPTGLLFWIFVIYIVVVAFRSRRDLETRSRLLCSPFYPLLMNGALAIRNSTLAFAVALPFLHSNHLLAAPNGTRPGRESRRLNLIVVIFVCTALVALTALYPLGKRRIFNQSAPIKLTEKIRASGKTCPIFDDLEVGGFLLLELPNRIFIDTRNIIFSNQDLVQYFDVIRAVPGWDRYLDRYGTCFAVLSQENEAPLITAMTGSRDWKYVSEENGMLLFEKKPN